MMTSADIHAEFDRWIEFPPGSGQQFVTTTSTLLFAKHIATKAASAEREARQAAQTENEALKARLAHSGVELRAAVLAEREECATACETEIYACCWDDEAAAAAEHVADVIRLRNRFADASKTIADPTDWSAA